MKNLPCFEDPEAKRMIKTICNQHQLDIQLLIDLSEMIVHYSGSGRRFGLEEEIGSIITRFMNREGEK